MIIMILRLIQKNITTMANDDNDIYADYAVGESGNHGENYAETVAIK